MSKQYTNAWREILTRIFEDVDAQHNVTPAWLVNPTTKRQLKLDLLYPALGVAVRFSGQRGAKQKQRPSLDEVAEQEARDDVRHELCEAHGISLADLDMAQGEPPDLFQVLEEALSQANRRLARDESILPSEKASRLEALRRIRSNNREYSRKVKTTQDLKLYLDLWQDRQFKEPPDNPAPEKEEPSPLIVLSEGLAVEHSHFGSGQVKLVQPSGDNGADELVTICFEDGEERTFMASLLAGKLTIRE